VVHRGAPCPSDSPSSSAFLESLSREDCPLQNAVPAGAVCRKPGCRNTRVVDARGEPGICVLRELLLPTCGLLWGLTGLAKSKQAHESFCGEVNETYLARPQVHELAKSHCSPFDKCSSGISQVVLLTMHIWLFKV
jgi:hypothetical protein